MTLTNEDGDPELISNGKREIAKNLRIRREEINWLKWEVHA